MEGEQIVGRAVEDGALIEHDGTCFACGEAVSSSEVEVVQVVFSHFSSTLNGGEPLLDPSNMYETRKLAPFLMKGELVWTSMVVFLYGSCSTKFCDRCGRFDEHGYSGAGSPRFFWCRSCFSW